MRLGFFLVLLLVGVVALGNFVRSIPFQLVDFDSFQYLTFSRSLLTGGEIYIPSIRSPLLSLVIPSNLLAARFLMVLFHIGTALLLYALSLRLFQNRLSALFAALAYGLSWWMLVFQTSPLSDLPGMFLFLLGLFFWLREETRSTVVSGALFGLAFLVRFDLVFLILPLILFTKHKLLVHLLAPLFVIMFPLELLADSLAYGRFVYAPWEFFRVNLLQFGGVSSKDFLHVANTIFRAFPLLSFLSVFVIFKFSQASNKILLSIFTPFFFLASYIQPLEPRIFMVKLLPLLALLSANFFVLLQRILPRKEALSRYAGSREARQAVVLGILILVVGFDMLRAVGIRYEKREFEAQDCVFGSKICSNFPSAVEYYCNSRTQLVKPVLGSIEGLGKICDSFVYFKDISSYNEDVNAYLRQNAELWAENTAAYVYRFR